MILFLFSLLFAKPEVTHVTKCKNGDIVRMLRVEHEKEEDVYVTYYTKSGVDKEIGRATNRTSNTLFMDNVAENLVKAGWKCSDISKSVTFIEVSQ